MSSIIELYKDLDFSKEKDFKSHMEYINQKIVKKVVSNYLTLIAGENFEKTFMSINDFLSIITINIYREEFIVDNSNIKYIELFLSHFENINKNNMKEDISVIYSSKIQPLVEYIKKILVKIIESNKNSVCNDYCKLYFNMRNLENDIKDEETRKSVTSYKNTYYNLIKEIMKDKTDEYIKKMEETLDTHSDYDNLRKSMFFDNLEKDLKQSPPIFDGVLYLLDVIKNKLCFLVPLSKKEMVDKINSIIDIKYIKQLIDNNVFDGSNLINIFTFIIEKIRDFHSAEDDKELDSWYKHIQEKYLSKDVYKNISEILPVLLKGIMDKLEALEEKVKMYRDKLQNANV